MSNKITAIFGADVSDVEAGVVKAIQSLNKLEMTAKQVSAAMAQQAADTNRALTAQQSEISNPAKDSALFFDEMAKEEENFAKEFDKSFISVKRKTEAVKEVTKESLTLAQANEKVSKAMQFLRGGALAAGVGMLIGQMRSLALHADSLDDKATDAQKSAAQWGKELEAFSGTIKGWGASALGTLASWGRSIGDVFRDPADKAYDDVAASSEEMATRQEEALKRMQDAHKKAADEIPKLREKLAGEEEETRLSALSEQGRALTEVYQVEKELAALEKQPKNAVTEAKRLELLIQLEQRRRKLRDVEKKVREEEAREAEQAEAKKAEAKKKADAEAANAAGKAAEQRKKDDVDAIRRARELADERQKAAEAESKANREAFGKKLEGEGYTIGEDGKIRRGNVIVSKEDAARTLATKERNEQFTAESKRGRASGTSSAQHGKGKSAEATLLEKIEAYLRPSEIR